MSEPKITLVANDLPSGITFADGLVAVDTETTGLSVTADKLCLVQVGDSAGNVWLVKLTDDYSAPNLKRVLADPKLLKIFHFARFDLAQLQRHLGVRTAPFFCTKIAHKLLHAEAKKHNLRALVREYAGAELDKAEQMSNWAAPTLTDSQQKYAALDVFHLAKIWQALSEELQQQNKNEWMQAALDYLPVRVDMDLASQPEDDLFAH
ncbi:MAG TPA: ribonuclease H-like domain-containing protein [Alphaproteobacteria bacterium]|nr:ribonuclease H-like domain-containing protein [Alphaproteobacteria bacterium]